MKTRKIRVFTLSLLLVGGWSLSVRADAVTDWHEHAGQAALAAVLSPDNEPFHESRMYAMMHIPAEKRCGAAEIRRAFSSFTQAVVENGVSRIYVGYHFRNAVTEGIKHGRKIADRAVNHFLKPVH